MYAVTGAVTLDAVIQQQTYPVLVLLAGFLLLVVAHYLLYMVVEAQQASSTTKVSVYPVTWAMSVVAMTQQQTYLVLVRLARFLMLVAAHSLLYMVVEAQQAGSTTKVGRKIALQDSKFLNFFFWGGGGISAYTLFGRFLVLFFAYPYRNF